MFRLLNRIFSHVRQTNRRAFKTLSCNGRLSFIKLINKVKLFIYSVELSCLFSACRMSHVACRITPFIHIHHSNLCSIPGQSLVFTHILYLFFEHGALVLKVNRNNQMWAICIHIQTYIRFAFIIRELANLVLQSVNTQIYRTVCWYCKIAMWPIVKLKQL